MRDCSWLWDSCEVTARQSGANSINQWKAQTLRALCWWRLTPGSAALPVYSKTSPPQVKVHPHKATVTRSTGCSAHFGGGTKDLLWWTYFHSQEKEPKLSTIHSSSDVFVPVPCVSIHLKKMTFEKMVEVNVECRLTHKNKDGVGVCLKKKTNVGIH